MLRLDHLTLTHPGFRMTADFTVQPGVTAVIGPSGSGKSSLLMAIAGFLAPAAGRILWQDRDITGLPPARRPVGMLFQDQNLFPHLTIAQNLGLALAPDLRLSADQKARITEVLARLGIAETHNRRPADLSGGQHGRAALGRVLLQARPIMLLDEPFAALGPGLKTDLLTLVRDLTAETGALTLLVTHDPRDAQRFAERTILVTEGTAQPPAPTSELFDNPSEDLKNYLGP